MKGFDAALKVVIGEDVADDDRTEAFSSDAGSLVESESLNGSAPNGSNSAAKLSPWNGSPDKSQNTSIAYRHR